MKGKLRIGILLSDFTIESWENKLISEIKNSCYATISAIIKFNSIDLKNKKTITQKHNFLTKSLQGLTRQDNRINDPFDRKIDASESFKDIPVIKIGKNNFETDTQIDSVAFVKIEESRLDVIINLSLCEFIEDFLKLSKHGIMSLNFDNNLKDIRANSGFWEVIKKSGAVHTTLEIRSLNSENCQVVHSSWESVFPFSFDLNMNKVVWRSVCFIPRVLEGIYKEGERHIFNLAKKFEKDSFPNENDQSGNQSDSNSMRNFVYFLGILINQGFKKLFFTNIEEWMILFSPSNTEPLKNSFRKFSVVQSPNDIIWADPFIISKEGKHFVFVEEFSDNIAKAHITFLELDDSGKLIRSNKVINRSYHMSYPFIFELDNIYYMIPETSENKTIELYKCSRFPDKWEFVRNIMSDINAVDTTVLKFRNKWWLFTSIDSTNNISGYDTELFLFYSDDIFSGDWVSHPLNPVVSDVRTARPAGKIFFFEDKIYRPSQDCSGRYGKGFNLNEIIKLSENEYKEKQILKVIPDWNNQLKGSHTFNFTDNLAVIDAYKYQKRHFF